MDACRVDTGGWERPASSRSRLQAASRAAASPDPGVPVTSRLVDVVPVKNRPPPKPTGGAFGQQAVAVGRLNKGFTDIFRYEPLRGCGRRGGERPDSDGRG